MSAPVTTTQLVNAGLDCDHIAEIATSLNETATDRLGGTKRTLAGAIRSIGWMVPVAYTAGLDMVFDNQTVSYDGDVYAPDPNDIPFTTSGTFEVAKFYAIPEGTLRNNLAGSTGTDLIGYLTSTLTEKLTESPTPLDYGLSKDIVNRNPNTFAKGVAESSSLSASFNYSKVGDLGWFSSTTADNKGWLAYATEEEWLEVRLPTGVVIGDSIAEGHPSLHGRLHNASGVFDDTVINQVGQPSYELSLRTGFFWWNHGIGGDTSTDVWDRWSRDALGNVFDVGDGRPTQTLIEKPVWIWVNAGINDVSGLVNTSVTKTNLLRMALSALENGIYIGFNTIGPVNSHTLTQRGMQDDINAFILDVLPQFGACVFDYHKFMVDPSNATRFLPVLSTDGVHPNKRGYAAMVAKLVSQSQAPIFLDSIIIEATADPDSTPSSFRDLLKARVFDSNLAKSYDVSFEKNIGKVSPQFDMTNTATIRIYATSIEDGVSGTHYSGISRVYCNFSRGGFKEPPKDQVADCVLTKTAGTWAVNTNLAKARGVVSVSQSSTEITIATSFPISTAAACLAGTANPYLFTISYSSGFPSQSSIRIKAINLATLVQVDPTTIPDGTTITVQGFRAY